MPRARWVLACLLALSTGLGATGCVPLLERSRSLEPDTATPDHFAEATAKGPDAGKDEPVLGTRGWKDVFPSAALRELIGTALQNNQELNLQIQELIIAQAEVAARHGEYRPKVRFDAGMGVDKVSANTSQGVSDDRNGLSPVLGDFRFGLVGSWEVDVWGKLRDAAAASHARYLSSVEARHFLVTQLVAEIANCYYDLLALDAKLAVLKRNIEIQTKALEMIRIEKQAARVTELAVQRFEAEVAKNTGLVYELEQERVQVQNRIHFLLGRQARPIVRQAQELDAPLPAFMSTGVPADLLSNRPDVRQAELELQAARLDVNVARANFLPSFAMDAGLGMRTFGLGSLLAIPESLVSILAGNLTAPWLNRAAIEAEYRSADARQVQALIRYERSILKACLDVSTELANVENQKQGYAMRSQQVERLAKSVELSTVLFRAARADYVEVLLTRRDLLEAELEWIELKKRRQQAVVNLYQALGGG